MCSGSLCWKLKNPDERKKTRLNKWESTVVDGLEDSI